MRWEDVPKIPEDAEGVSVNVRAPACPVDNVATLRQGVIAVALLVFMGWLAMGALTSDPITWLPAVLALFGVAGGIFMIAGVIKSRMSRT